LLFLFGEELHKRGDFMKIFDENGIEIEFPDLEKGYLKNDVLLIKHHSAVEAVEEQGHYEVVAKYPNGGQDVDWVVDVPGIEGQEAWDETEDILRYIPYTELELKIREFEKNRQPLTAVEVLEMLLPKRINEMEVDDATSFRMKQFYPEWEAGHTYSTGFKIQRNDKLWKVLQAHTSQVGWEPENVPALFEQINETHSGTDVDPIPYEGNMALSQGLYYYQDGVFYLCTRDTINPVHHHLKDLVGLYVEIVE
jgi:hypothetical protein